MYTKKCRHIAKENSDNKNKNNNNRKNNKIKTQTMKKGKSIFFKELLKKF